MSMFDKKKFKFKKEFKFPYYYYTYEIDMTRENAEKIEFQEDTLFDESEMDSMFREMFKIGYTVEVFGSIVETNGNKMDDNKVKFNIGINTDKVYYVKFKDFFLSSWIGSIF